MKKLCALFAPIIFCLFSFGPTATVENHHYDVFLDGRAIGAYHVNKTELNGTENFRIETNTAAGLIRRDKHRFVMLSSYDDSKLIVSDLKNWMNGELQSSTLIHWDGNQYVQQSDGNLKPIFETIVTYSSACMFFEEPVGISSLFYEKYGKKLEITDLGEHQYEVLLPNGGVERYSYLDGKVLNVAFIQSFATISLHLKS